MVMIFAVHRYGTFVEATRLNTNEKEGMTVFSGERKDPLSRYKITERCDGPGTRVDVRAQEGTAAGKSQSMPEQTESPSYRRPLEVATCAVHISHCDFAVVLSKS